jgi:endoglucanase Acf2/regulation of enolase protein 1 (concanavalin A-like superfamily)
MMYQKLNFGIARFIFALFTSFTVLGVVNAQTVGVGAGSYTTSAPPGSAVPQSTIYETHGGPIPTHKFWTSKYWNPHGFAPGPVYMFPEPLSIQVTANGLVAGYYPSVNNNGLWFNKPFQPDLTVGTDGLNTGAVNVSRYSDWTVDFDFGPITTRVGRGMPFIYVTTNGSHPTVTFNGQPTIFANNGNILGVSIAGNNYGLFGPAGSAWSGIGTTKLTCNLAGGATYFSLAILPSQSALSAFASHAFSFPVDTRVSWNYDQSGSQVTTTYNVITQSMDGVSAGFLMALYPHQYASLPGPVNTGFTYASPRGQMRVWSGNSFTTVDTFNGVLPYLPRTPNYNAATLQGLLNSVVNEGNHYTAGDTYFGGKKVARIAQLLPIAQQQDPAAFNNLLNSLKGQLQFWFTAAGKNSSLFYYDDNWGSLIGYPASFGSDTGLTDHHFHYGYWIHAAAMVGLYDRNWIAQNNWGGIVDLLRRDIASIDRGDSMFPFLRNFDVYAGHSWASAQAPFGDGGNEESTSEAINAWAGMILLGTVTGDTQLRDAGIWLYTQETKAAFYYWFNAGPVNTFPAGFSRIMIANLFDAKSDWSTWFGAQPEFVHGIEFLPFTGTSLYLGRDPAYCQRNFNEVLTLNGGSLNLWQDLMEMYEAFFDPADAINRWNSTTFTEDGESRAHQYAWLHTLSALGRVHTAVTANWPFHAVFRNPGNNVVTHVAFNPTGSPVTVNFSDGASLNVPAGAMISDNLQPPPPPPQAPTNLTATPASASTINLSWTASATAGVTYSVFRSVTSGFTPSASNQIASGITGTAFTSGGLAASTTYFYRITAVNAAGSSMPSNQAGATTPAGGGALPNPWLNSDVGAVGAAGSASHSSGVFTVRGSGSDIWGTTDGFQFVYQSLNGNGQIVARVTATQNTDPWAKAGVMIRETLAAGSKHAFMALTPGNGLAFQRRVATDGVSTHTAGGASGTPVWVRLARNNNTITASISTNGATWTQVGADTVSMGAQVLVGLAVTSHAAGALNTSTFDNVQVSGGGGAFSNVLYVMDGAAQGMPGLLSLTPGVSASTDSVPGAGGGNHDGSPTNPLVYTLSGLTGAFDSARSTQFTLYVDAGAHVGDAVQLRVSYDFTGDGVFDRVETYRYFPTNDLSGWEAYTQTQGLLSASGVFTNLSNGRVQIEVWTALGTQAIQLRASASSANGQQSLITIPFN